MLFYASRRAFAVPGRTNATTARLTAAGELIVKRQLLLADDWDELVGFTSPAILLAYRSDGRASSLSLDDAGNLTLLRQL